MKTFVNLRNTMLFDSKGTSLASWNYSKCLKLIISVTAAAAKLKFLQESDLDQIYTLLKNQRRRGSRYGGIEV